MVGEDPLVEFNRQELVGWLVRSGWGINNTLANDIAAKIPNDDRTKPYITDGNQVLKSQIQNFRAATDEVTLDLLVERGFDVPVSKVIDTYTSQINLNDKSKFTMALETDPEIQKYKNLVLSSDFDGFKKNVERVLVKVKADEKIKPYADRLFEMVEEGIRFFPDLAEVNLAWDKKAYDEGQDASTKFKFLPSELRNLNPVQQTALVIYTLQERRERGEVSQPKNLQLLDEVMHLYKTIFNESYESFPQKELPLQFLENVLPSMINNHGYVPVHAALQERAREAVLDETLILDEGELSKIIESIRSNPELSDVLQEFHADNKAELWMYTADEETNNQFREIVWRGIPRLIEAKGYQSIDDVINSRIKRAKWDETYDAMPNEQDQLRHVEVFENTTEGRFVYVAPDSINSFVSYLHGLVNEKKRSEREEIIRQSNYQKNQTAAVRYAPKPENLPISVEEIKDGEASVGLESQNGIAANKSSRVYNGPSFEDISRDYNSSLRLPSRKRSPNKIWNMFQSATSRYNSFLHRNPESAIEYQTQLGADIIAGEDFIRQLRSQPKDYINRFESQLDSIREYFPETVSQPQEQTTVKKGFFSNLFGR